MDVTQTILAGGIGLIPGGKFIYCLSATHDNFELQPMGGENISFHEDGEETFEVAPQEFRVWNKGADLTVSFRIKDDGKYRDNRFVMSGGVTVDNFPAAYPDGLTEITRHGYGQIGASYAHGASIAGVLTILAPATNTAGVIIRTLSAFSEGSRMSLFADTAAPLDHVDATKRRIVYVAGAGPLLFEEDRFVEAGSGLYIAANGTLGLYSMTFDIL